jgi:hypothetical protein
MDIHLLRLPQGSQGLMPAQKMPEILRERGERIMQKRENRKRYIQKLIRLTPEEDRQIKTAMAQMGVPSFQYYAKNQLVQGKVVQIDFSELKDLRVAINRVGTNINQIAKHANENQGVTPEEVAQLIGYLFELKEMVAVKLSSAEKKSLQERKVKTIRTYDEW